MPLRPPFALTNLACAFLAGPWTKHELRERGKRACPGNGNWMRVAVNRVIETFGTEHRPSFDAIVAALMTDSRLSSTGTCRSIGELFRLPAEMQPRCEAAREWNLPAIVTKGQLVEWLGIPFEKLAWLAQEFDWSDVTPREKLRHYVYSWQPRRGRRYRLIESPKPMLKAIQRRILREILDRIPPHDAAHGFRRGRSVLTFASPHVERRIVLRFDLRDFFTSVRGSRIRSLFQAVGYPIDVSRLLSGLCTTRIPADVWQDRPQTLKSDQALGNRLLCRHLPQGAPTSPALANLCAYRLDVRLGRLAESVGSVYTRYADDLAFSGDEGLELSARRFQVAVAAISYDEGFVIHFQKSRFMRRGVRQQLAGVVVNEKPNIQRVHYDEVKAILTNCVRHGPSSQNRDGHTDFRGHLRGRIAHVRMLNPTRGAKLLKLFDRIRW